MKINNFKEFLVWHFKSVLMVDLGHRYANQTCVARHEYEMSGEYEVLFNVTGRHYPSPGIQAKLHRKYFVVDEIGIVKLRADHNNATFEGNQSHPVKFHAR